MEKTKIYAADEFIDARLIRIAKICSEITSVWVFLVGALVLVGWEYDIYFLTTMSPLSVVVKPNAAAGLMFLGFSLWLLQEKRSTKLMRVLGQFLAGAAFVIGFLTFIEYIFGFDLGIDQLLYVGTQTKEVLAIFPDRMGFAATLNLMFSSLALIFLGKETERGIRFAQILSIFSGIFALVTIVGYVFSVASFYTGIAIYAATSQYFAISIFFNQLGIVFARPGRGLSRIFVTTGSVGKLSRVLFPASFLLPVLLGWLLQLGKHEGFYSENFEMALYTTISIIIFSLLITSSAILLGRREEEKLKVEKESLENEKKYHNLVNVMNEGLGVQDKNGVVTFANKRMCELLGYSLKEIVGKPTAVFLDKENQKILQNQMAKRSKGQRGKYELAWLRKDGEKMYSIMSSSPIYDEKQNFVGSVAAITDITERKKVEFEREQFLKFFNLSTDIMVIADPNGAFKKINSACLRILGYSESELVTKPFIDFVYPDDKQETLDEMARQIKTGSSLNFENRYVCKDGRVLWLSWRATYDKIDNNTYATARDVTEEKKAFENIKNEQLKSAALAKDLEKFKQAVDGASDHVIITDNEGIVLYLNKAAENITGYRLADVMGKKAGKIWGGHMPHEFYENLWRTIKIEKKAFFGEVLNYRKNGQPYTAELRISPILGESGQVQFFVGIERDITKIKEMDQMKNDFISFTSHQLRTPLTVIKWNTEMMRSEGVKRLSAGQKRYLTEIEKGERRMALLISSLLNISRLESGKIKVEPKLTDVIVQISSVISEVSSYAKAKNCAIIFNQSSQPPLIVGLDLILFKQVLLNLLTNAIRYSKPEKSNIEVDFKEITGYYQVDIIDDGIGIPEEVQGRVFDKFFRAENAVKANTEGTGLGLYIIKMIIERSGGKIWFESKEGEGSAFHFTIPKSGMKKISGEKELSV